MNREIADDIELLASFWTSTESRIPSSKKWKRCEAAALRVEAWLATFKPEKDE